MVEDTKKMNINDSTWILDVKPFLTNYQNAVSDREKIMRVKELCSFLISDIAWMQYTGTEKLILTIKKKLVQFKNTADVTNVDICFFRHVEEVLGFRRYCKGLTKDNTQCGNRVPFNVKRVYCMIHYNKIHKISNDIGKVLKISSDLTTLIAEYVC